METGSITGEIKCYPVATTSTCLNAAIAIVSTINLVFYVCFKTKLYFPVPAVIIAKLYSNTMLVILNNRINIIGGRDEVERINFISSRGEVVSNYWVPRRVGLPWRLRKRSRREEPTPGGGVIVLTETWSDAPNKTSLQVVSFPTSPCSSKDLTFMQSAIHFNNQEQDAERASTIT
jgi:hypothetical protein